MVVYDILCQDVAVANGNGLRWYQLYVFKDRGAFPTDAF